MVGLLLSVSFVKRELALMCSQSTAKEFSSSGRMTRPRRCSINPQKQLYLLHHPGLVGSDSALLKVVIVSTFVFIPSDSPDSPELFDEERLDIRRIRQAAPQLADWSDAQVADLWERFSRDLRGLSWCDSRHVDIRQFMAFVMVKQLFPKVDAEVIGYEAFQLLGNGEPWVTWPEVQWPAWTDGSPV